MIALTRCHGRELGEKNIQVSGARADRERRPARQHGFDMARADRCFPLDQAGNGARPVGTLIYLASPDNDFVTGQTLNVDGGKINL